MRSSIVPLSLSGKDEVVAYLTGDGIGRGLSEEEVLWKYYDEEFNAGRERGFAWLKHGRVCGFIGCIPATLSTPVGDHDMIWTCDWSIDTPYENPGMGVLLLSKVQKMAHFTAAIGGTADTRKTVPRMHMRTVPNSSAFLFRPLTLGAILAHAEKKLTWLPPLSRTGLASISLPVRRRPSGLPASFSTGGVAVKRLARLFDRPSDGICRVRYDERHLAWLGRYPGGEFRSFHIESGTGEAGALLWQFPRDRKRWRVVLRQSPVATDLLSGILPDILQDLRKRDGAAITTILSSHDAHALALCKRHGFLERGERQPLYMSDVAGPAGCAEGFADISYLDTDMPFIP